MQDNRPPHGHEDPRTGADAGAGPGSDAGASTGPGTDAESQPDAQSAAKTLAAGGVIFNPWVNIITCVVITLALGVAAVFSGNVAVDIVNGPAYEGQGLDIVGVIIGAVVLGIATIVMIFATILVVRYWMKHD